MSDRITHLAGTPVTIGKRVIQRCLVCGYKLLDIDLDKFASFSFGTRPKDNTLPLHGVGHLIEVREGYEGRTAFIDRGDTGDPVFSRAWDDCCLRLVEGD